MYLSKGFLMILKKKRLLIGAHLSISQGFAQAALNTKTINATALQIFTKSNRSWSAKKIPHDDIIAWNNACKEVTMEKKNICIHASYLINLASNKPTLINQSQAALIEELDRASLLEVPTVVLHPGSRGTQDISLAIKQIATQLQNVFDATKKTIIAIESMAGQGSSVGSSLEELAAIIFHLPERLHNRIGVCLDTCHLFTAGYDLTQYDLFWQKFDTIIGRKFLKIIHINDSKMLFNSHKDRHEQIGQGKIPKEVFFQIMNDASLANIPKIIETPKSSLNDDYKNIKRLLLLSTAA